MNMWNTFKVLVLPASLLLVLLGISSARADGPSLIVLLQQDTSGEVVEQPYSSNPVILTDEEDRYSLGLSMDILEDPNGELTIEEVASPAYVSQFTPSQVEVPNYGYTDSIYWVRLRLDNQTQQTSEWLLEDSFPNTQYIDLYTPLPGGMGFDVRQTGVLRPISTRDVLYPNIVFRLNIAPQSEQIYYLRFQNGASMTMPLTLWTSNAFFTESSQNLIFHWLLFGGLLALLVYHLFLLFSVREITYLYFVILLVGIIAVLLEYLGYMSVYFFPNLYPYKAYYFPVLIGVMYASIILFSDSFLELKTRLPVLHRINIGLLVGWGVLVLLVPLLSYLNIARLMSPGQLISVLAVWIIGFIAWRKGARPVGFFMLAWLGMAASLVLLSLVRLAIVPSTWFNENIFQLGLMAMAVSWSFALADRINLLKADTEKSIHDLRKSEYRLSQILEGFPLGVVLYGEDQKPQYMNKRTSEILADPASGIRPSVEAQRNLAQAVEYYSFKSTETGESYPLEELPTYKALSGIKSSADNIVANIGGRVIPLEIWASPVSDDSGKVETAITVFQDITERKQSEVELAEYRKSLELLVEKRTMELNEVNERLRLRLEWLSITNMMQQKVTGMSSLGTVYEELSFKIHELFKATLVFILRWEDQKEHPVIYYSSSLDGCYPEVNIMEDSLQKGSPLQSDIESGKTIIWRADQPASVSSALEDWFKENDIQVSILAPMLIGQTIFGVLGVAISAPENEFVNKQLDLVERIAFDLARLSEDAVLLEQKLALVALDERNRLARDLHDSVTQVLFTATLLTEIMPQIWRRDPEQGMETLEKLRQLTRGALAEMRTMLIELRPSSVVNAPLSQLVAQLTEAITCRSGLPFQLVIENIPPLPEDVQMNFYRITQEALNNVVKHAQALHVVVTLSEVQLPVVKNGEPGRSVKLVIQDDGVGFYTGGEKAGHLGLGIMRERAAAINATLSVVSEPGHGTIVSLIWWSVPGSEE